MCHGLVCGTRSRSVGDYEVLGFGVADGTKTGPSMSTIVKPIVQKVSNTTKCSNHRLFAMLLTISSSPNKGSTDIEMQSIFGHVGRVSIATSSKINEVEKAEMDKRSQTNSVFASTPSEVNHARNIEENAFCQKKNS